MRKACKTLEVESQNYKSNLRHISILEPKLSSSSPLRKSCRKNLVQQKQMAYLI